jgi:uncharacterized protein YaeQ
MALTATVYNFDVNLADVDRGVYETLAVRAALHPSETEEFLVTRLLAYCLEYEEGISFSKGVSDGRIRTWIEIGAPDAARLHKAAKTADRVAVYTHKDPASLLRRWAGERIHRAAEIPVYGFERQFLDGFAALLERRMSLHLSISGRQLYLDVAGRNLSGAVSEHRIA